MYPHTLDKKMESCIFACQTNYRGSMTKKGCINKLVSRRYPRSIDAVLIFVVLH